MLFTIKTIQNETTKKGDPYLKLTGVDGNGKETTKLVFNNLQEKWALLKENATVKLTMTQTMYNGKAQWNVTDISPIAPDIEALPKQEAKPVPEGMPPKEDIPKEGTQIPKVEPPPTRDAHIEKQVALKEVGELYRAGFLSGESPHEKALKNWYFSWLCKVAGIRVEFK